MIRTSEASLVLLQGKGHSNNQTTSDLLASDVLKSLTFAVSPRVFAVDLARETDGGVKTPALEASH